MAGRPRRVRSIQSYINNIDNHTFSGPMKTGTAPSVGVHDIIGIITLVNVTKTQMRLRKVTTTWFLKYQSSTNTC